MYMYLKVIFFLPVKYNYKTFAYLAGNICYAKKLMITKKLINNAKYN